MRLRTCACLSLSFFVSGFLLGCVAFYWFIFGVYMYIRQLEFCTEFDFILNWIVYWRWIFYAIGLWSIKCIYHCMHTLYTKSNCVQSWIEYWTELWITSKSNKSESFEITKHSNFHWNMNEFVQHAHNWTSMLWNISVSCAVHWKTLKCKQIADVIFKTLQNPGIHFHRQKSRFDILH